MVLPVLIENCDIPELIKTKKYADFRKDYSYALEQLIDALPSSVSVGGGTSGIKESIYRAESAPKINAFSWSNFCYLDRPVYYWFSLATFFIVPTMASLSKAFVSAPYVESAWLKVSLPFMWKIPFFAAIFYLASMAVYRLTCPTSVAVYKNYNNFSRAISSLIDKPQNQDACLADILASSFGAELSDSSIWKKLNNTRPYSRVVAYALLVMSFTLIFYTITQMVLYVVRM